MRVRIPEFGTKAELFSYLKAEKQSLIRKKRSMDIWADPVFSHANAFVPTKGVATKDNSPVQDEDTGVLRVKVVANTANWIDSHMDLILPDAPLKSIKERAGMIPMLHDHEHKLEAEIGDVKDIYLADVSLRELGLDRSGKTQSLIFVADIKRSYNEKVYNKYRQGRIKQHSIGLRYVKLTLAINDEEYEEEFAEWNKYIDQVINREVAEEAGYFWPVQEYMLIENSAVLFGSNVLTPTLDNNVKELEPDVKSTQNAEPSIADTQYQDKLNELLNILS